MVHASLPDGPVAQLGARLNGIQEVTGCDPGQVHQTFILSLNRPQPRSSRRSALDRPTIAVGCRGPYFHGHADTMAYDGAAASRLREDGVDWGAARGPRTKISNFHAVSGGAGPAT